MPEYGLLTWALAIDYNEQYKVTNPISDNVFLITCEIIVKSEGLLIFSKGFEGEVWSKM